MVPRLHRLPHNPQPHPAAAVPQQQQRGRPAAGSTGRRRGSWSSNGAALLLVQQGHAAGLQLRQLVDIAPAGAPKQLKQRGMPLIQDLWTAR
jgi:hypothetical protein